MMNELKPSTLVDAEEVIEQLEERLEKSESATARARYAYDRLSEQMEQNIERAQSSLKAKNDALEAQLAEAKKDSARLDYLETPEFTKAAALLDIVAFDPKGHGEYHHYAGGTFGKTVRTAIDDAMQGAK